MHLRAPAAVLLTMIVVGCGGGEPPQSQPGQETTASATEAPAEAPMPFQLSEEQQRGEVVYETMCWSCHGTAGRGDGPAVVAGAVSAPPNLTSGLVSETMIRQMEADFRAEAGGMDQQHPHMQNVLSIVDADAFTAALNYLPALAYPPELPGSAIAGRKNYILRCQECHGTTGEGNGPGAAVLDIKPANFVQDTLLAARDFQAVFNKIRMGGGGVHGSSMPAWGVMFSDADVWDLVAYISTFQPGVLSSPPTGDD